MATSDLDFILNPATTYVLQDSSLRLFIFYFYNIDLKIEFSSENLCMIWSRGYSVLSFTNWGFFTHIYLPTSSALVAQQAARQSHNLKAVSSIHTRGIFYTLATLLTGAQVIKLSRSIFQATTGIKYGLYSLCPQRQGKVTRFHFFENSSHTKTCPIFYY